MATRILLIDDDDLLREAICDLLESEGYEVTAAEDGNRGLESFQAARPEIVITDIMMPDRNGIETIVALSQENPQPRIIAISGGGGQLDSLSYLKMAERLGADRVLEKPFRAKVLLEAVESLLESEKAEPSDE